MDSDENRRSNVNYLMKAASLLPSQNYAQKLLKSYYLTKCKKLAQSDLAQTKTLLSDEEMCRKCSTPWADAGYSISIAPIKVTQRKARKLHKQIEDKSKRKNHLAKKFSKRVNNIVTVKCDLCKHKNKVVLYKKSTAEAKPQKEQKTESQKQQKTVVQKIKPIEAARLPHPAPVKKKKKDKNAGLLYSLKKDDTNSAKKIVNLCQQTQTLNIQKKAIGSNQFNKNTNQNANKNKRNTPKGPKQKSKNISQPAPRRANIMLLANALKAKSNQSNSQVDKLKQMLR
ncbi:uncharacterized protein LOC129567065 [Sitodiplosis mosellana]|uniref:uncharacterized protein LOC129567065 n=1 Tax=Sitodiplosis mosellana TaxID=263140 RepID=UPI0024439C03|nr:uncharacterized protein LOC129567065 [Sitodiplosis mosellana]